MKYCIMLAGLLILTSCTKTEKQPAVDLTDCTVHLKEPVTISFLDEKDGLAHFESSKIITDMVSRLWKDNYVSCKLARKWDGDMLVVESNTSEYRIPYSSISHFERTKVKMVYDKESNRWSIKGEK